MQPFSFPFLAKLEMYPDFSDSLAFILVGFCLVLIVLALIYLVCEIIGAAFKLSVKPAVAPAAAVAADTPGTPPKAPEKSAEENDPRLVAVIAAAVHTVIRSLRSGHSAMMNGLVKAVAKFLIPTNSAKNRTVMKKNLRITVEGRTYEVTVEVLDGNGDTVAAPTPAAAPRSSAPVAAPTAPAASAPSAPKASAAAGDVVSPLAAVVVSVDVTLGQSVKAGDKILTLEAMKMNTLVTAPSDGKVTAIHTSAGSAVEEGAPLITLG
jgi:biotin carboxyl carrier protein/Na+-transporting methylmalonyl-CoA/oxaloacetate decarboxylase gamma subunit